MDGSDADVAVRGVRSGASAGFAAATSTAHACHVSSSSYFSSSPSLCTLAFRTCLSQFS